ncbi:MAG: YcgN family cysteine cluster protein [Acetobacter sp.]|uniref:YcgN family cysteine cluster protein n=1 Tax=Acetobacter sp. TaxID=440 RepID=UPI0039ED8A11
MTSPSVPRPFWETTALADMTRAQWESLCDGCGRCCLHKLRDDDTEELHYTSVACRLLDVRTCQCTDYPNRLRKVQDCITLTASMIPELDWLPPDCAYRRLANGQGLPQWHPLLSGTSQTVITSGASAAGRCISERRAGALEDYIVTWPGEPATPDITPDAAGSITGARSGAAR